MAKKKLANGSAASLGFVANLKPTAEKRHNNMNVRDHKHLGFGLIVMNRTSDAFEERHQKLVAEAEQGANPQVPDEYQADNFFWVPAEGRGKTLHDLPSTRQSASWL